MKSECIYLFRNQNAILEDAFYFRNNQVFVRVATFGEYTDPKWYLAQELPDWVQKGLAHWIDPGLRQTKHTWYIRTIYPAEISESEERVFLPMPPDEEGKAVEKWFHELRRQFIRDQYLIAEVPEWIKSDPRIDKRFGLGEKLER